MIDLTPNAEVWLKDRIRDLKAQNQARPLRLSTPGRSLGPEPLEVGDWVVVSSEPGYADEDYWDSRWADWGSVGQIREIPSEYDNNLNVAFRRSNIGCTTIGCTTIGPQCITRISQAAADAQEDEDRAGSISLRGTTPMHRHRAVRQPSGNYNVLAGGIPDRVGVNRTRAQAVALLRVRYDADVASAPPTPPAAMPGLVDPPPQAITLTRAVVLDAGHPFYGEVVRVSERISGDQILGGRSVVRRYGPEGEETDVVSDQQLMGLSEMAFGAEVNRNPGGALVLSGTTLDCRHFAESTGGNYSVLAPGYSPSYQDLTRDQAVNILRAHYEADLHYARSR